MICISHSTGQSLAERHLHPDLSSDLMLTSMSVDEAEWHSLQANNGRDGDQNAVHDDCKNERLSSANISCFRVAVCEFHSQNSDENLMQRSGRHEFHKTSLFSP